MVILWPSVAVAQVFSDFTGTSPLLCGTVGGVPKVDAVGLLDCSSIADTGSVVTLGLSAIIAHDKYFESFGSDGVTPKQLIGLNTSDPNTELGTQVITIGDSGLPLRFGTGAPATLMLGRTSGSLFPTFNPAAAQVMIGGDWRPSQVDQVVWNAGFGTVNTLFVQSGITVPTFPGGVTEMYVVPTYITGKITTASAGLHHVYSTIVDFAPVTIAGAATVDEVAALFVTNTDQGLAVTGTGPWGEARRYTLWTPVTGAAGTTPNRFDQLSLFSAGVVSGGLTSGARAADIDTEVFHGYATNGAVPRITLDAIAATPIYTGRRADGTNASKSAVQNGEGLVMLSGRGYGSTGYSAASVGNLQFQATQNFTDAHMGTAFVVQVTPTDSTTVNTALTITSDGMTGSMGGSDTLAIKSSTANQKLQVYHGSRYGEITGDGTVTLINTSAGNLKLNAAGGVTEFNNHAAMGGSTVAWGTSTTSSDLSLARMAAGVLGVGNAAGGNGALQIGTASALTLTAGAFGMPTMTASASAPGAAGAKFEVVCGAAAGSAKLIMYAGTSTTAQTIIDNVGSGVTGC